MNEDNAVAVVGMACRFPGANDPDEFWEVLEKGENHIQEVPDDRWNKKFYYSKDRSLAGKTFAIHAGILKEDVRLWDNKPFGINVMEAELMDPQQRLVLETSYRALEDGGFTLDYMNDSNTAVYMGLMNNDFQSLAYMEPKFMDNYSPTGTTNSILSNRVSYFYNVHGPSVTVDTACSSGLVAVNLGAQSILSGESDMAMCGGVACILSPTTFIALSKARMASEKGQCHTYTENADGYVRSEGCGVVILKNFKKAMADGDKIYGLVTSACNSDGKASTPITSPSSQMQAELIRRTLNRAGLTPEQIQLVEMHGTGTPVGDPIEVSAVGSAIGAAKKQLNLEPVPVGSVKTNIGHLEAGAGIAGLMKVLLMMKNETMAPNVMFGKLKESLNLNENHVHVLQQKRAWDTVRYGEQNLRIASVNSFGFGGTNVHLVAQSSDSYKSKTTTLQSKGPKVVLFTGFDASALKASMVDTQEYLSKSGEFDLDSISNTSCHHRTMYANKCTLLVDSLADFKTKLGALIENEGEVGKRVSMKERKNVVFVFCGMGTHWKDMGAVLYETEPIYAQVIDKLHDMFEALGEFDLKGCISGKYDLSDPKYGQPSIFACQVALFELWVSRGVEPNVIVGHSVGEVAAAYASNSLTLEDAAFIIFHRGRVVSNASDGGMLAVGNFSTENIVPMLKSYGGKLDIAAFNSPNSCTISGSVKELEHLQGRLESLSPKPFLRRLAVRVAYHSSYMDPVLPELLSVLDSKSFSGGDRSARLHISTVTGRAISSDELCKGKYWAMNVRQSVRFSEALSEALVVDGTNVILEVGPKPALKTNIKEIAEGKKYELFMSMTANKDDVFYTTLSKIYEFGAFQQKRGQGILSTVPRYAFQREMLYKEPEIGKALREGREIEGTQGNHPFVFQTASGGKPSITCKVNHNTTNFVYEHRLDGNIIIPGATYAEMGIAGVSLFDSKEFGGIGQNLISARVHFSQVCLLKDSDSTVDLKVSCYKEKDVPRFTFDVTVGETQHAAGSVTIKDVPNHQPTQLNLELLSRNHDTQFDDNFFYDTLETYGFTYGPSLRCIKKGTTDYSDCVVELVVPDGTDLSNSFIHPAVLDSVLQGGIMFPAESGVSEGGQILPYGVNEIILYRKLCKHMFVYMKPAKTLDFTWEIDAVITDASGIVLAECKGVTYGLVGKHLNYDVEQHMFTSSWKAVDVEPATKLKGNKYLAFCEKGSVFPFMSLLGSTKKIALTQQEINEIVQDENTIKNYLPPDLSEYKSILFLVGFKKLQGSVEELDGPTMDGFVRDATFPLLQIVKIVSKYRQPPPIFAVTKGVYSYLKDLKIATEDKLGTVVGVTLNAMCRSVNKEIPSFGMHTIDIDALKKQELTLFEHLISSRPTYFEYVISEGQTFYGTLDSSNYRDYSLGKVMPAANSHIEVHIEKNKEVMVLKPSITDEKTGNQAKMKVVAVKVDAKKSMPSMVSNNLSQMMGFDAVAVDDRDTKYHVCQHFGIATQSYLLPENCMPWRLLPTNFPVLSYWLSLWNIMAKIKKGQTCKVINNDASPVWQLVAESLADLLRLKYVSHDKPAENTVLVTKFYNSKMERGLKAQQNLYVLCEKQNDSSWEETLSKASTISYTLPNLPKDKVVKRLNKFKTWMNGIDKKRLKKVLNSFDQGMEAISDIHTLSHFTNVTVKTSDKPTFLAIQKNGKPIYMAANQPKEVIRADGGYLLVGGRKGLGWETLKYLVNLGAKYIGVISRSGLEDDKSLEAKELEVKHNCKIIDIRADTCIMSELRDAFEAFKEIAQVQIRGVFYGAAVTCDSIIPAMDITKFMLALSPKVCGVWNTYLLCRNLPLDIFAMYSSITSTFGNAGQTNYGAGNSFKDAIAVLRRIDTGVGQSICWGALDLGILVDNQNARKKVQQLGLAPMKLAEILTSLDHALVTNPPIMAYVRFIWPAWYRYLWSGPEVLQIQYESLIKRYCHHLKRGKKAKELMGNVKNNQEYVVEVLKTVAVLGDEDITLDSSMSDLGADSQDRQKIYNVFMEDIGFSEEDMTLIQMGEMTLSELIKHMNGVKVKYGKADSGDGQGNETRQENNQEQPQNVEKTSQIKQNANDMAAHGSKEKPSSEYKTEPRNVRANGHANGSANGHANGHINGSANTAYNKSKVSKERNGHVKTSDAKNYQASKSRLSQSTPNLFSDSSATGQDSKYSAKKGFKSKLRAIFGLKNEGYTFDERL